VVVDSWGAITSLPDTASSGRAAPPQQQTATYINQDGLRTEDGRYKRFLEAAGMLRGPHAVSACQPQSGVVG
jgi:hypothetical protein